MGTGQAGEHNSGVQKGCKAGKHWPSLKCFGLVDAIKLAHSFPLVLLGWSWLVVPAGY